MRVCSWTDGAQTGDVTVVAGSSAIGGFARWVVGPPAAPPSLPRSFQVADLDRSFEQNRLQINPNQRGDSIQGDKPAVLSGIVQPLAVLKPARVTVERERGQEATTRVTVTYAPEPVLLSQVVLPLWTAWGPGRVEGGDEGDGNLALVWQDGRTRCTVHFPASATVPVRFVAED